MEIGNGEMVLHADEVIRSQSLPHSTPLVQCDVMNNVHSTFSGRGGNVHMACAALQARRGIWQQQQQQQQAALNDR